MTVEAFGTDTLERLSDLQVHGHPVLSAYVDLDPSRFPTPAARDAQLGSLLADAQHDAAEKDLGGVQEDVDHIQAMLHSDPTIVEEHARWRSSPAPKQGILDAVRLPSPVEPMAVVDTVPWLEPLAGIAAPGDWGVAVVSRRSARLLRGGPGGLAQFVAIHDQLHRRHAQGGWSQARFQRGIEEEVAWHVRGVADRLLRAHRRRPFEHLVIIASDELRPVIEHSLHHDLTDVLAGTVNADLEHASVEQIMRAVGPVIEETERDRERALVAVLEQGLGTGGTAAAGLDEVLSMLEQQRVDTLLVPERSTLVGRLVPKVRPAVNRGRRDDVPWTARFSARSMLSSTQCSGPPANRLRYWSFGTKPDGSASMARSPRCCAGEVGPHPLTTPSATNCATRAASPRARPLSRPARRRCRRRAPPRLRETTDVVRASPLAVAQLLPMMRAPGGASFGRDLSIGSELPMSKASPTSKRSFSGSRRRLPVRSLGAHQLLSDRR